MVDGKVFAFFCSGSPGKVNFFDCSLVPDALQWIHVSPRLTKWRSNSFELCLSNVKNYCEVVSRLYYLLALLAIFRAPGRVSLKTKMQPRRSSLNYFWRSLSKEMRRHIYIWACGFAYKHKNRITNWYWTFSIFLKSMNMVASKKNPSSIWLTFWP